MNLKTSRTFFIRDAQCRASGVNNNNNNTNNEVGASNKHALCVSQQNLLLVPVIVEKDYVGRKTLS